MAKMEEPVKEEPVVEAPKKSRLPKPVLYGAGIILIQIVIAYALVTFLKPNSAEETETTEKKNPASDYVYEVKDVIINPAGTNGSRYLLVSVGFQVSAASGVDELKGKDVEVRDALITVLATRSMAELSDIAQREVLRRSIFAQVSRQLKSARLQNIFFSKYIMQ